MYVYISPDCQKHARDCGILHRIETLRKSIETQGPSAIDSHFKWNYPYLKYRLSNFRLLGRILPVENERVFCFLKLYSRGDPSYEHHFLNNPEAYGNQHFPVDEQAIAAELRAARAERPRPVKPSLPPDLHLWLQPLSWQSEANEGGVYETPQWVEGFNQREIADDRDTYYALVSRVLENIPHPEIGDCPTDVPGVRLCQHQPSGRSILYAPVRTRDAPDTAPPDLLLIAPHRQPPTAEELAAIARHLPQLAAPGNGSQPPLSRQWLARHSQRHYPQYRICDENWWFEIQQERNGHFALSAEEEAILQRSQFPLFVNGRAGSGKSTMLFYIFAQYYERYVETKVQRVRDTPDTGLADELPIPLFLTYNKRLLETARQNVRNLLRYHPRFADVPLALDDLDRCFAPFQDFLLKLLSAEALEHFDRDRYLSFHQFEREYRQAFPGKLSAAESWHAIRAFIKGCGLTDLSTDDYARLPRRERTLDADTFAYVCDRVYPWYCDRLQDRGLWDDRDLIRAVLQQPQLPHHYSAIVCDEAQDFTKLELEAIVQLSTFAHYELHPATRALPFTFAGDPLQTLNPTGFRWDAVRATFYEQTIARLDPDRRSGLEMNVEELESNYRSSPAIVRFTNLIHLWRHISFAISELKPQMAWNPHDGSPPQKFIFHQNLDPDRLAPYFQTAPILIVPCEEGGELDYVRHDPVLRRLFPEAEGDQLPDNVLSASQAKGLEFPLVVLYGFGDAFAQQSLDIERVTQPATSTTTDSSLALEYFFNKLYVAASRATEDLAVFDTEAGDRALWQFADAAGRDRAIARADRPEDWGDRVGTLERGDRLTVLSRDNQAAQAQEFFETGLSQENPEFLRRAQRFYQRLQDGTAAARSEAHALRLEGQPREAGRAFLALQERDWARSCFWEGRCWRELVEAFTGDEAARDERAIATFMVLEPASNQAPPPTWAQLQQFARVLERCRDRWIAERTHKPWRVVVQAYAAAVASWLRVADAPDGADPGTAADWRAIAQQLEDFAVQKYAGLWVTAAACYDRGGDRQRAVACWERGDAVEHPAYWRAKAAVLGAPAGVPLLRQAEDAAEIVRAWTAAQRPTSAAWREPEVAAALGWALRERQQYRDWLYYLLELRDWRGAIAVVREREPDRAGALHAWLVRQLARSRLSPEAALGDRPQFQALLRAVLANPDWSQQLTVADVGATFERVGEFVPTLAFYERFVEGAADWQRTYARQRWLATKQKQAAYSEAQGDVSRAAKIRQTVARQARRWNLDIAGIATEPQAAPAPIRSEPLATTLQVRGIPDDVARTQTQELVQFKTARLWVGARRAKAGLRVSLGDRAANERLLLQVTSQGARIESRTVRVDAGAGEGLRFRLGKACVGRLVYCQGTPQVTLRLAEWGKRDIVLQLVAATDSAATDIDLEKD